jgi:arylsulfatase A-like enzyme
MTDAVLITIDSLRQDHLGCYDYERNTSPNIDDIANDSHRFSNAFAHAGTTRKSFPTILTSSYTHMYGGYERITEGRTLISEVLKDKGYTTAGFHSNLFLCSDFGYQRGFDTFYDSRDKKGLVYGLKDYVKTTFNQDGLFYSILKRTHDAAEKSAGISPGSAYVKADKITDMSVKWLKETDSSGRFLWTHYMDVHHPYLPPEKYQLEFRDTPISDRRAIKLRRKMLESPDEVTEKEKQDLIDLYDAEIRFTDHEIGRLVDEVKRSWGDDTVVIITADHGEEFQEHGQFSHNTLHDEGIHVPLILDSPDGSGEYDDMVGLVDVSPTIAEYAGCDIPENFYGRSLKSLVEDAEWERECVIGDSHGSQGDPTGFLYRDKDWKYLTGPERIYRLENDTEEKENIVDQAPPILSEIRSKIENRRRMIKETSMDIDEVEMDEEVTERLEKLGYKP